MKVITDLVSPYVFVSASILTSFIIFIFLKLKIFKSIFDPSLLVIFQVFLTGLILTFCNYLNIIEIASYLILFVTIYIGSKSKITDTIIITEQDWQNFTKIFLYISLICNAYLLYKKGFILFQPDQYRVKVEYYQGYGIFKRLIEIAIILIGVTSIYLFKNGQRKLGSIYFVYSIFNIFSLGSKAGLIFLLFILGGIIHFYPIKISKKRIIQLLSITSISIIIMFNLIYDKDILFRIYYRIVSYADGPIYFYEGDLFNKANFGFDYLFDQLFTNIRINKDLQYLGLGPFITKNYFQINDPLFGPNPQIIIESKVLFNYLFVFYIAFVGFIFGVLRRFASTPYSFLFICMFINPLLLDGQLAFSNLLTLFILFLFLLGYYYLKFISRAINKD